MCANPEAAHRFTLLAAYLLDMFTSHYQRHSHIKIQAGILTGESYLPATYGDLMQQHQLEFLRLNPAESWKNALMNNLPPR